MAKDSSTTLRPFGMKDKLSYACGDVANDFTFMLMSTFMLKFYTDIMGVSSALVGAVMFAARFVDAFTDVGMGTIVDMTDPNKSKLGKFRIWILRGCLPVAAFGFLVFGSFLRNAVLGIKIVWMFVTYILWGSVFYTMVNIPYGSMASAITDDPDQRTALSSFRSIGATIAGLVLGVAGPLAVYVYNDEGQQIMDATRMMIFAAVCGVIAVVFYLICVFGSVDRVYIPPKKKEKEKKAGEKGTLTALLTDKALLLLIISTIFMLLTQMTQQSMAQYIYPNYYGDKTAQATASAIGCIAMIVVAFFAPKLVQKFGKRELGIVAMGMGAVVYLVTFLIRPENVWVFIALQTLSYIALGAFTAICFAMIIDVIDNAEVKTGNRDDGKYYGVYSFARKLGQALSSLLAGGLLEWIGYDATTAYDPDVLTGIFNVSTLIPAVGYAVSAVFLVLYPMKKSIVDANATELASRREQK